MASTASIRGHPVHPMLVVLPIGLWVFSLVSDIIFRASGDATWHATALYTMAGGIVGALLAAVPGLIDLFTFRDPTVKRIGLIHMALNLTIVVLYAINLGWRLQAGPDATGPIWLSLIAIALLVVSGWLGGEMVYVHGAGVRGGVEGTRVTR
jgi:uncharacterized membrane protein